MGASLLAVAKSTYYALHIVLSLACVAGGIV